MKQLDRTPIVRQVADGIIAIIKERNLREGDKLPTEKELCESFNVGRSTIREATRVLQTMGMLTSVPGKGMYVENPNQNNIATNAKLWFSHKDVKQLDYVEIRLAIEPLCTKLAIQRATMSEIADLARIHSLCKQAVSMNDTIALASYDEWFHFAIANATHNKLMISIQEAIKKEVFEMRLKSFSIPERIPGVIEPHEKILQAFYDKDEETGFEEMARHIKEAFSNFQDDTIRD